MEHKGVSAGGALFSGIFIICAGTLRIALGTEREKQRPGMGISMIDKTKCIAAAGAVLSAAAIIFAASLRPDRAVGTAGGGFVGNGIQTADNEAGAGGTLYGAGMGDAKNGAENENEKERETSEIGQSEDGTGSDSVSGQPANGTPSSDGTDTALTDPDGNTNGTSPGGDGDTGSSARRPDTGEGEDGTDAGEESDSGNQDNSLVPDASDSNPGTENGDNTADPAGADAFPPDSAATPTTDPVEEITKANRTIEKNQSDQNALKELIQAQTDAGAKLSDDFNDGHWYQWEQGTGRLIGLYWDEVGLKGNITFENLPELKYLSCEGNKLTALDVSKNLNLVELTCPDNEIDTLDLTNNTKLVTLERDIQVELIGF